MKCIKAFVSVTLIICLLCFCVATHAIPFASQFKVEPSEEIEYKGSDLLFSDFLTYSINGYENFTNDTFDCAKLTIINFWATWCGPCIEELPILQQVADNVSDEIQIVTVLYDSSDSGAIDNALAIMDQLGFSLPVYRCNHSTQQAFYEFLNPPSLPTNVLVYQGGYLDRCIRGRHNYDEWMSIIDSSVTNYDNSIVSGICGAQGDNLTWSFNPYSGLLEITGVGEMMNYDFETAPWYEYRDSIEQIALADGVTTLGEWAFYDCSLVTSIDLPESLEYIYSSALSGTSLSSLFIPRNVVGIEDIFDSCMFLEEFVVDPNNSCYASLDGVLFNKEFTTIERFPPQKAGNYMIPEGVTTIGNWAFYDCDNIDSLTLPETLISIDSWAFTFCLLQTIELPSSLECIESYAFSEGFLEGEIIIPASVNYIGDEAFSGCFLNSAIFLGGVPEYYGEDIFGYPGELVIYFMAAYANEWSPNGETEWNGYPIQMIGEPIVAGDADGDGVVTSVDALLVMRAAMGIIEATPEMLAACDFDLDGILSSVEALLIMRYAMGIIDELL